MKTLSTSLMRGDDPLGCRIIFRDGSLPWFLALKTCLCPDIRIFFFFSFLSPLMTVQLLILPLPVRQQPES